MNKQKTCILLYFLIPLLTIAFIPPIAVAAPNDWETLNNGNFETGGFGTDWSWWSATAACAGGAIEIKGDSSEAAEGNYYVDITKDPTCNMYLLYLNPFSIPTNFKLRVRKTEGANQDLTVGTLVSIPTESIGSSINAAGDYGFATDCNVTSISAPNGDISYKDGDSNHFHCGFSGTNKYLVLYTGGWANNDDGKIDLIEGLEFNTLTQTLSEPQGDPVDDFSDFNIATTIRDEDGDLVSDVNARINFNSEGWIDMNISSTGVYAATFNRGVGNYSYDINVTKISYISDEDSGTISVRQFVDYSAFLKVTPISNISSYEIQPTNALTGIHFVPLNESNDLIYRLDSNADFSIGLTTLIFNARNDGKRYKIYSASETDFNSGIWNFDDTATFGSTNYDSVQKIWDFDRERYEYSFGDTILASATIYYKIEYYEPAFIYSTLNHPYWDNQLDPNVSDINGLETDLFLVSTYSDLSSFLTIPRFPPISSNLSNVNYVFQFTARTDAQDITNELKAGTVTQRDFTPATALNLDINYQTLTITGIEDGFIKIESAATTSREFRFQNYAITERGYFTKPLKIFEEDGTELPILISDSDQNTFSPYIVEGKNFMVHSEYNDPDNKIDRFEIAAYIDTVAAGNKVKKWEFAQEDNDGIVRIRAIIGGLIDLTANAPDRTIVITLRLIDVNENYYEIQKTNLTMRQFPKTFAELNFRVIQGDQLIGEHPKGRIIIDTIAPENIIGIDMQYQDWTTDNNNADFNKTFYKDIDFTCGFQECIFDYEITDAIFSAAAFYHLDAWVLVKTEEKSGGSPYNDLLHEFKSFKVSWIAFDTARIFQTMHRAGRTYRNDEPIPLVVQLRDSTGLPSTLKDRINVKLRLEECDNVDAGIANCRIIDLNYTPDSTLFDATTGYTYYHFRQIFVEEDFNPLSDANWFRVMAFIEDPTFTHQTLYRPVLADKCQDPDPITFFANMFTMNIFNWGCNSGQFTDAIVSLPDNNAHEETILIDADFATTNPRQFWWMCISPDQNGLYTDVLAQDVLCFSWYLLGQTPVDEFKFWLLNENSDLGETDDELKQYVEVTVPFELVYTNDMHLLREGLKAEFSTDWTADNPPTIGDIILLQADHFLGSLAPTINIAGDFLTASGLIGNIGFEMGADKAGNTIDFNFNTPLDPRNVDGLLTFKIKNINVINKKDYETLFPQSKNVPANKFTLWAKENNVRLDTEPIQIDVYVSDNVKVISEEDNATLVIDVDTTENRINRAASDANALINFESMPTRIQFRAMADLIFNNKLSFDRRYLILPYTLVITDKTNCGFLGLACLTTDGSGTLTALITQGDLSFFALNWFAIFMVLITILFISVVYGNVKGKGINIFNKGEG